MPIRCAIYTRKSTDDGLEQEFNSLHADVSRFLPLAFLAPGIVEALMNGRQGVELTAEKMRQILPIPCSWREQRHQLNL